VAAVSLFWNTNMAAVTSCENALYYHSESSKLNLKHLMKSVIITVFARGEELTGLDKYHVRHEHFESFTCSITPINFCAQLGTGVRYARPMQIFEIQMFILTHFTNLAAQNRLQNIT